MKVMSDRHRCAETSVQNAIKKAVKDGLVRFKNRGKEKLYHLTDKGLEMVKMTPKVTDSTNQ